MSEEFLNQLRSQTVAVRLSVRRLRTRKTISQEQRLQAAQLFGAELKFLSASKRLFDTKNPTIKNVTACLSRAKSYWRGMTVPYPDAGVRLLYQPRVGAFIQTMSEIKQALSAALDQLCEQFDEIKQHARGQLGELYHSDDYASPSHSYDIRWEFPTLGVPEYIRQLNPQLYEAQMARLEEKLHEAVQRNEEELVDQLNGVVGKLIKKLEEGKIVSKLAINEFDEFFQRFDQFGDGCHDGIKSVAAQARLALEGVDPSALKKDVDFRNTVAARLRTVGQALDAVLIDKPARAIDLGEESEAA